MAIFGELYDELYVFVFYVVTVNGVWIDWNRNLFCGAGVKKSWCRAVRVEAKHLKNFRTVFTKFGFYLQRCRNTGLRSWSEVTVTSRWVTWILESIVIGAVRTAPITIRYGQCGAGVKCEVRVCEVRCEVSMRGAW